ncbi:hypothetical protein T10_2569 [Trichinella papuae]|uniref:Uncharacterized protein n=1 Tax=Trichinella papuae TaxID=268474 RepID=A0A0V1MTU6_9BILA|nr:hypothetical protein T10_2569 [Trichinella papuae]
MQIYFPRSASVISDNKLMIHHDLGQRKKKVYLNNEKTSFFLLLCIDFFNVFSIGILFSVFSLNLFASLLRSLSPALRFFI